MFLDSFQMRPQRRVIEQPQIARPEFAAQDFPIRGRFQQRHRLGGAAFDSQKCPASKGFGAMCVRSQRGQKLNQPRGFCHAFSASRAILNR
jgi:hypothetical protein